MRPISVSVCPLACPPRRNEGVEPLAGQQPGQRLGRQADRQGAQARHPQGRQQEEGQIPAQDLDEDRHVRRGRRPGKGSAQSADRRGGNMGRLEPSKDAAPRSFQVPHSCRKPKSRSCGTTSFFPLGKTRCRTLRGTLQRTRCRKVPHLPPSEGDRGRRQLYRPPTIPFCTATAQPAKPVVDSASSIYSLATARLPNRERYLRLLNINTGSAHTWLSTFGSLGSQATLRDDGAARVTS
jgi:hypothetical protein